MALKVSMTVKPPSQGGNSNPEDKRRGYKDSELGIIPATWNVVELGDFANIEMGQSPPSSSYNGQGIGIPLLNGPTEFTDLSPVAVQWTLKPTKFAREGDVLLCVRGSSTGRINISDGEYCIGRGLAAIRAKSSHVNDFTAYVVAAAVKGMLTKTTGSTFANIDRDAIRRTPVILPPAPEQRGISSALRDTEALLSSLDRITEKKRGAKQGAMQQLLTGRTRLPGFTEEWPVRELGATFEFLRHASNPRAHLTELGTIHYLHYGDVHGHGTPFLDCSKTDLPLISADRVVGIPRLENGDLIIADASEDLAGVGKSVELLNAPSRGVVGGLHTIIARGKAAEWAPGFKAYLQFLPQFKSALERAASGVSVYAVSKRNVAEISLSIPPVPEQRAIVAALVDMDAEISALETRRGKIEALIAGMAQNLLSGRIRLPVEEESA